MKSKSSIHFFTITMVLCGHLLFRADSFAQSNDSITVAIAPGYDSVSGFHRFLFGEGYRKLWAAPVKMKVFYLSREKGGLTITEQGGGLQTKSLRLKDASGKEWVLRSVQKYPERGLPKKLKATIAKDILQDQVITSHPYAALTVPPLAKALGILHTNPQIVYVPDDPALGKYRADFANSVLLFEEREPAGAPDTDNTEKAQKKVEEDHDVRFDQKLVLRARLLDLLVGDWDRHEDQWRWAENDNKNQTVYTPFPRDRDKVYYTTSGIFPGVLSSQFGKANLQPFGKKIKKIGSYNFNNRYFDRYFLNNLSEEDWKEQIAYVQNKLTDDLIKNAIRQLPDTIYKLSGEKIISTLIARKNHLPEDAMRYYRFLARNIDIPASDEREWFELSSGEQGNIKVTVYKINDDGSKGTSIYDRNFSPGLTEEIRLFGLGGNDVYSINGKGRSSIRLHMIGGDGVDSFYIDPGFHNRRKFYIYDRSDEQNSLPSKKLARLRTSTDTAVNYFDRKNFKYDKVGPVLSAQYDLDLGFMMRAGVVYERQGFRREPYAKRHALFMNYAPARKSFLISYNADLTKLFGQNDLSVNLVSRGPHNVSSFFGVGNESVFENKDGQSILYYRNRYDHFTGDVKLRRALGKNVRVNAGVGMQFYTSLQKNNFNKFLATYHALQPGEDVFSKQFFTGFVAGAEVNSPNASLLPSKGFYWNMKLTAMQQLNGSQRSYGQVQSEAIFYLPLLTDAVVLANRLGGGTSVGSPAFYQQFQLGGYNNLRGYYVNRFTGKSVFYHNIELRAKLFDFISYLFPGSVGVIGFNDLGRVWTPGESSKKWHHGYGGGIFVVPADLILIQAAVAKSAEGTQPYVSIGFSF